MTRTARGLVFGVLFSVSAGASAAQLEELPWSGGTIAQLVEQVRAHREGPRTRVIAVDWEAATFLIPAAGSVRGNQGTFYRSDVTIANRRNAAQRIAVGWIAQGIDNGNAPVKYFNIAANTTVFQADFVGTSLGTSGLGAILVLGVDAAGNFDTNAILDGFSRIWSPQPNASGTVSQEFAAVDPEDTLATSYGYGLRQDAQYRTNVGFVNLYNTSNTYTVNVVGTGGNTSFSRTVKPYSMDQVGVPAGNWGDFYIRVSSAPSNFNWWSAYGSSVDNLTGDGWVSHVH